VISVRPIISTSTGPIFTKFTGLVELWPWMNDVKLFFFDLSRDVAIATNFFFGGGIDLQYTNTHRVVHMTFARAAPAYNKKGNCYAGRRQTNYLIRWTHANQLNDQLTIINRRRGG